MDINLIKIPCRTCAGLGATELRVTDRRALDALRKAGAEGLLTTEIAGAMRCRPATAYSRLRTLERAAIVRRTKEGHRGNGGETRWAIGQLRPMATMEGLMEEAAAAHSRAESYRREVVRLQLQEDRARTALHEKLEAKTAELETACGILAELQQQLYEATSRDRDRRLDAPALPETPWAERDAALCAAVAAGPPGLDPAETEELAQLRARVEACSLGDRPSSPAVATLRRLAELEERAAGPGLVTGRE